MKLDEILAKPENLMTIENDMVYLDGVVDTDEDDQYFRLYPDPYKKTMYLRIKKEDITGEIHEYDLETLKEAGLKPELGFTPNNKFSMYQIPVKLEVEVDCITVQKAKIGVEYPLNFAELLSRKAKSSCSCKSEKHTHEVQSESSAYCDAINVAPCAHPTPCKWCNTMDNTCKCSDCCIR